MAPLLLIVGFGLCAPSVAKAFRPAVRSLGDEVVRFGENLKKLADEGTDEAPGKPNGGMDGKSEEKTASPATHEEVDQHTAADLKGTSKATPKRSAKTSNAAKSPQPPQPKNPKSPGTVTKGSTPKPRKTTGSQQ